MRSIELFAGAGGLAMGISLAGFKHEAIVDWNHNACNTIRQNQSRGVEPVSKWGCVTESDVRKICWSKEVKTEPELVAGGPPCQPFSLGGKHQAFNDERDMFPEAVRAVRELRPKAFIFENVKGLLRESFSSYFEYITLQLTYPEIMREKSEGWPEHRARLERHHTQGGKQDLSYQVVWQLINAANHGVPQRRERVFLVGFRRDLGVEWSFPNPTHSSEALLWDQCVSGEYWERHKVSKSERKQTMPMRRTRPMFQPKSKPWLTVRDAISDLPTPINEEALGIPNHKLQLGARPYAGHTGSPLDEAAKTLKAGDHGVPGGENMLALPNGDVRYFTVKESARLQTFPDDYIFHGSWTECMRQLGNAVPVRLANVVANSVKEALDKTTKASTSDGRNL
jgi:DNA (cytosine-5)-methyltransferase 1